MRKYFTIMLLLLIQLPLASQVYEPVYPGYWPKTYSGMFAMGEHWYRTGLHNLIEVSTDKGGTWVDKTPPSQQFNILSVSASQEYAIGTLQAMRGAPPDWEDSTHSSVLLFTRGEPAPRVLSVPWVVPVTDWYLRKFLAFAAGDALFVAQAYSDIALIRSTDAGATWTQLPLPDSLFNHVQIYAHFHDRDRGILLGLTPADRSVLSVFVTHDAGAHWSTAAGITTKLPPTNGMSMYIMPIVRWLSRDTVVLIDRNNALLLSADGGVNWQTLSQNLDLPSIVDMAISADGKGYVACDDGRVARTADFGSSYITVRPPLGENDPRRGIATILCQPEPGILAVTDRSGSTQYSTDDGVSWEIEALQQYSIDRDLTVISMDTVFVRMKELATGSRPYVRTFDGGATWEECIDVTSTQQFYKITFVTPSVWYGFRVQSPDDSSIVHRSRDAGASWQAVLYAPAPERANSAFKGRVSRGDRLFCFVGDTGIHFTTDGGDTWMLKGAGIVTPQQGGYIDISQYPVCYFTSTTGFYRSGDGGDTWSRILDRRGDNLIVTDERHVYFEYRPVGPFSRMLLRSSDGGATWDSLKMAPGTYEFSYIDEHGRGSALGYNARAFLTTDDFWQTFSVQGEKYGDNPRSIQFLDRLNGWASLSRSILRTTNGGINWTQVIPPLLSSPRILSVWPQPADQGGMLNVQLDIGRPGAVRLEVYDMLGRRRAVVFDAWSDTAQKTIQWSPVELGAGVYILRMLTVEGVASRTIVKR
jgi:photosystem II stability/assembly factor-like uncharacterized protein